jgi:hypothetical protein
VSVAGKRRLNFASFTTKEHLYFSAANHYHVDIIAHVNLCLENSALNRGKY